MSLLTLLPHQGKSKPKKKTAPDAPPNEPEVTNVACKMEGMLLERKATTMATTPYAAAIAFVAIMVPDSESLSRGLRKSSHVIAASALYPEDIVCGRHKHTSMLTHMQVQ